MLPLDVLASKIIQRIRQFILSLSGYKEMTPARPERKMTLFGDRVGVNRKHRRIQVMLQFGINY